MVGDVFIAFFAVRNKFELFKFFAFVTAKHDDNNMNVVSFLISFNKTENMALYTGHVYSI